MAPVKTVAPGENAGTRGPRAGSGVDSAEGTASVREVAAERLADYFRSLGLRDDRFLELAVSDTLRSAEENRFEGNPEAYVRNAMEGAVQAFEQWLDQLLAWARGQGVSHPVRGCIAWRLRGLVLDHPEAFLRTEGLPDGFREALLDAAAPVVPEPNPLPMAPQKIGRAWFFRLLSFPGRLFRQGRADSAAGDDAGTGGET